MPVTRYLVPALTYCKIKRKKLVYDIFDFYAESRYVGKLKRPISQLKDGHAKCDSVIIVHEKRIEQLELLIVLAKKSLYYTILLMK